MHNLSGRFFGQGSTLLHYYLCKYMYIKAQHSTCRDEFGGDIHTQRRFESFTSLDKSSFISQKAHAS